MDSIISQEDLKEKLDYLNLDLENIPECLTTFNALNFNTSRLNNDKDHKVYKFVPINQIDILLTPCLREDSIKKKYSKAVPLYKFLENDSKDEEAEERKATLLKVFSKLSIPEIENVSTNQKSLEKTEPFKVKFAKDLLWQIYYSEATDRYFMMVCTEEETFSEFFYLLKAKIAFSKRRLKNAPKIYVPINYVNYSEAYLRKEDINDLENYLWLFTKNWPSIYEVYNKTGDMSLQIVGDTLVYEKVKSTYKVKLSSAEDATKFFKLLKALFIMQTEIKEHFIFTTKIDSKNNLELYYKDSRITYDNVTEFIRDEFKLAEEQIKQANKLIVELNEELSDLKTKVAQKEEEYLVKQKEISTYLEYKKTFLGKVKYFFKSGKINKKIKEEQEVENKIKEKEEILSKLNLDVQEKEYYTIEDLITAHILLEKGEKTLRNSNQDINALKLKLENLISKVRNANLYIEEIDKHKKSIFEFWKFSNKDEKLSLEMGNNSGKDEKSKNNLRKVFDFEMDFEDVGNKIDLLQRKKLSKEETDSIFIANSELIYLLNMLRCNDMDKNALENALEILKEEYSKDALYVDTETFDIFGSMSDDNRKIKYLGNRSHRETEKSKFKILNVNKKIDVFDFTEKMQSIVSFIEGAVPKITSPYDMSLYKVVPITEKIQEDSFEIFDLNVENELKDYQDNGEGALNLIKINYKEGMPLLYYTNIIYYDNNNQTLPEGMNLSSKVLLDTKKLEFKLISKSKFRTNNYFTESNNLILPKSKDILVYEYEVDYKKVKEEKKENLDKNEQREETVNKAENEKGDSEKIEITKEEIKADNTDENIESKESEKI